jgi:hypothetical protein
MPHNKFESNALKPHCLKDEEDWFDYRLENDPRFLKRIEQARNSLRSGARIKIENI